MIRGDHTFIRGTEQDDVEALFQLYMLDEPKAGLLDARRERLLPNRDEIRDLLTRKEITEGGFYTVEGRTGAIAGFCSLRGLSTEAGYAEYSIHFGDSKAYESPVADEAHAFLCERAFVRLGLRKVLAHVLSSESALTTFLQRSGFSSAGVQREVLFAQGGWHHLETFVLNNPTHHVYERSI